MDDGNGTSMGPGEGAAPSVNVLAQYVKDFSFENPNAPQSLQPREAGPQLNINVNVGARPLSATEFEVDLSLQARAGQGAEVIFAVELVYSGLFRITNVPEEHLHPFVLIECPRLLFPSATIWRANGNKSRG
ncbi:protein-export chaperone SecB, partial [Prosthecomicrobium hirschii]